LLVLWVPGKDRERKGGNEEVKGNEIKVECIRENVKQVSMVRGPRGTAIIISGSAQCCLSC
jgi:hypothetical protein